MILIINLQDFDIDYNANGKSLVVILKMASALVNLEKYLSTLNPLASKFSEDIEQIKTIIGKDSWLDLNEDGKEDVINFHMIDSFISSQYESYDYDETDHNESDNIIECFPRLKIYSGEKIIVDF